MISLLFQLATRTGIFKHKEQPESPPVLFHVPTPSTTLPVAVLNDAISGRRRMFVYIDNSWKETTNERLA